MEQFTDNTTRLHYDLKMQVDPLTQYVAVSGSLVYHAPSSRLEYARFYLHRQLEIQELTGSRVLGYHYDRLPAQAVAGFPEAGVLDVYFNPPLVAGETAFIKIQYDGYIREWPAESANVLTPDWVELSSFLPWYPLVHDGSPSNLTFTLQVDCPPGYTVASLGPSLQQNGTWFFNWGYATSDMVVALGRQLASFHFESESNQVRLYSASFSDAAVQTLGEDVLWILERLAGWFGPVRPSEITLIEAPRDLGGGYARRGLVVLSGIHERDYLDERETYLHDLAHEAAHAWWWRAPAGSWEDWLNESFAEYSALMALRERYGNDAFQSWLERKRERAANIPPLWGFDRADTADSEKRDLADAELHDQGPWLLNALVEKVGNRRFLDLCRGMQWAGVTSTAHFLEVLEELEGKTVSDWMANALKGQ